MGFKLFGTNTVIHLGTPARGLTQDASAGKGLPAQALKLLCFGYNDPERGVTRSTVVGVGEAAPAVTPPPVEEAPDSVQEEVIPEPPVAPPVEEPSADQDALIAELREEHAAEKQKVIDLTAEIAWRKVAMGEEEAERFEYAD